MARIPIAKPLIGQEELEAVRRPLESGWVVQGPEVQAFEGKVAAYTGAAHAVATSSGTTALHVALAALGLEPGDEVIVPAFTWVSTANVVHHLDGTAVFCDIDLATFNLDPAQLESLVTERTVGVVPVHLFGLPAPMDEVLAFARRHGLWVLEDCACSLGAWIGDTHTGLLGDLGALSFHPRKSVTTGEGGMVFTDNAELAARSRSLCDHGAAADEEANGSGQAFLLSDFDGLGFNFRLTDIQGAVGSAQMDRLDEVLAGRRAVAGRYSEALAGLDWLAIPSVPDGVTHGWQAYVTLYRPEEPSLANVRELNERRNALMTKLDERGIATRQGTHAPVLTRLYRERYGVRPDDFPNAVLADRLSMALPLYPQLTEEEQATVVRELVGAAA
jgi:dTDP-4-amino-4,6-dideoxygalactose transaminase